MQRKPNVIQMHKHTVIERGNLSALNTCHPTPDGVHGNCLEECSHEDMLNETPCLFIGRHRCKARQGLPGRQGGV